MQEVVITTPLEPEQVESLRVRHPDFEIVYPEGLLVSPHSASTVDGENEKIVDLFSANLLRYRAGGSLLNVLDSELLY